MLSRLKKIRVVTSIIFLIFTSILFLDITGVWTRSLSEKVLFLQFVPSLLEFINITSVAAIGFVIIILATLFSGRIYCSTVCPLGILQDIVIYSKRKILKREKKRLRFNFQPAFNWVRYSILTVTAVTFLFGNLFLLYSLDPYSNYGRILTHLIKPIIIGTNNIISNVLEMFDNYSVSPSTFNNIDVFAIVFAFTVLFIVVLFSYKNGRFFCNSLCPVGAFLGFLSKFSLFRIVVNKSTCISCGVCETVCKSECIDTKNEYIDFTRCVSCFNCFDVCPTHGLKYEFQPVKLLGEKRTAINETDHERRSFLINLVSYSLTLTGISYAQKKIEVYKKNKIPVIRPNPITPPGSVGIDYFTDSCTACQLCISACPTHVLQPSFLEYGFLGMMVPMMDNKIGFCDYECTICSEVCPTNAIQPIDTEKKKLTQLGKAKFIKDNCVVQIQGTACGACSEHCPTKAVAMVPYKNNLKIPEVNEKICIGCGACEFACPTIPYKAIYVESNVVHLKAEPPKEEKIEEKVDFSEDFPF
ncbi:4Fe-4S ferredoxin iron-sulfur binding domain protein [hydrothermal vent metagenome]|uniref:4Fe-4S ferredoxin iron-sulfur binding domain protein n=1 Tax=hydrothermal vent metagenome TaxID=652676 RepID=A0A3B1C7C4_9ZZZZ